ncbi:MAG: hypothetical protein ACRD29_25375 [Acidimicrobiales bacterium]
MAIVEQPVGETRRERRLLVAEAGFSQVSFGSVLAGVLVAYGAFAVLAAIVGGLLRAFGVETDVGNYDWETVGGVGTGVVGLALFVAYLFGGYVAGRMAFRAGFTHGLLVFVLGVVVAAVVGLIVGQVAGTETIEDNLRSVGVPTTADEWGAVGTIAGIVSLAAMLIGALLGGSWGERWHGKLRRRAASVEYGPEAASAGDDTLVAPAATDTTEMTETTATTDATDTTDTTATTGRGSVRRAEMEAEAQKERADRAESELIEDRRAT